MPNGWRLSGEGGEADRVRCSRGLGDGIRRNLGRVDRITDSSHGVNQNIRPAQDRQADENCDPADNNCASTHCNRERGRDPAKRKKRKPNQLPASRHRKVQVISRAITHKDDSEKEAD